jgi:hypothetical protein
VVTVVEEVVVVEVVVVVEEVVVVLEDVVVVEVVVVGVVVELVVTVPTGALVRQPGIFPIAPVGAEYRSGFSAARTNGRTTRRRSSGSSGRSSGRRSKPRTASVTRASSPARGHVAARVPQASDETPAALGQVGGCGVDPAVAPAVRRLPQQ